MATLVLTLGEGVERVRLTPEGARGLTVEGMRALWKVRRGPPAAGAAAVPARAVWQSALLVPCDLAVSAA
jgi:hypothetical protein